MPLEDYAEQISGDNHLACCDARGCMGEGHENVGGYSFCRKHADIVESRGLVDEAVYTAVELLDTDEWKDLKNRYAYHAPKGDQLDRYRRIREACLMLAGIIKGLTPASREQSVALTHLDQVMFNSNAAIARNE